MTITIQCEQCHATYQVPEARAGQAGRCRCGHLIPIPGAMPVADSDPPVLSEAEPGVAVAASDAESASPDPGAPVALVTPATDQPPLADEQAVPVASAATEAEPLTPEPSRTAGAGQGAWLMVKGAIWGFAALFLAGVTSSGNRDAEYYVLIVAAVFFAIYNFAKGVSALRS